MNDPINPERMYIIFKNCFLKLKTFLCYDKTLLHLRAKAAEFENDPNFESLIKELAVNFSNKNIAYFNKMIESVYFVAKPKKFYEEEGEDYYAKLAINRSKKVSDINFFIDCDIRLLIVDMFYMLAIKKIANRHLVFKYCCASQFKESVFKRDNESIFEGIDFVSNRCFKRYFDSYKSWRDNAFKKVEDYSKKQNDKGSILFSLDIQSFYYSVDFSFSKMHEQLNNDGRLKQLSFCEKLIISIYNKYFTVIKTYRNGLKFNDSSTPFPIGMFSPIVLRDIYLNGLDMRISSAHEVLYYGRYVDDILILFANDMDEKTDSSQYINRYLVETGILIPVKSIVKDQKDYLFNDYSNLRTSFDNKDRYFVFKKGEEPILIKAFKEVLNKTSSEESLLPDLDFIENGFDNKVYGLIFNDTSHALRNLNLVLSDISSASHYMRAMISLYKGTSYASRKQYVEQYIKQINNFFDDCLMIQYSQSWTLLFESLVVLGKDYSKQANDLFKKIKTKIKDYQSYIKLDGNSNYNKKNLDKLSRNIRDNLIQSLYISLSTAFCLSPLACKSRSKDVKRYISIFRKSNMFNQSLSTIRLIGYLETLDDDLSLIDPSLSYYFERIDNFSFNLSKISLAPIYFQYNDLALISIFRTIKTGIEVPQEEVDSYYSSFNHLEGSKFLNSIKPEFKSNSILRRYNLIETMTMGNPITIGLPNVPYTAKDVAETLFHPYTAFDIDKKISIINILLDAKRAGVTFLVFPELYFPFEWINDVIAFAKVYGMTIVLGALYVIDKMHAYNFIVSLIALSDGKFKYIYPSIREKIYYPHGEKEMLASADYYCDNRNPVLDIFVFKDFSFSNLLCFELTDIFLRNYLKNEIDLLIVPELNLDTNYFSSIIESTARDLYIYVVQENSSIYGDSRITGPFDTLRKNLVQFKGGDNKYVVAKKLDFVSFKTYKDELDKRLNKYLISCSGCTKVNKRLSRKQREKLCNECIAKRRYDIDSLDKDPAGHIKPKPPKL